MELRISQIEIKLEATSKTKINYLYANIDVTDFPEEEDTPIYPDPDVPDPDPDNPEPDPDNPNPEPDPDPKPEPDPEPDNPEDPEVTEGFKIYYGDIKINKVYYGDKLLEVIEWQNK